MIQLWISCLMLLRQFGLQTDYLIYTKRHIELLLLTSAQTHTQIIS